jgi:hypothetical protein
LLCGSFDPREEEAGVDPFRRMVAEYPSSGLKLYTAEWRNGSRGWRLNDPRAYKIFVPGPGIRDQERPCAQGADRVPPERRRVRCPRRRLCRHRFSLIVEHVGLPRLDDFCWIAAEESYVYAGLSVAMAFVHLRPRYFAEIMGSARFGPIPGHLAQAARLLLDDVKHGIAERTHELLRVDRPDAADHARTEILLDPFDRRRRRGLEERGSELEAMRPVVDSAPAGLDELAGRDHRRVTEYGDQVALTAGFDAQHAEPVLFVLEGDALDEPG